MTPPERLASPESGPPGSSRVRRILVTGGAGFIGERIVRELVEAGDQVTVLDLHPPIVPIRGARYVLGDVRDPDAVRTALGEATTVFHLAAAHHDSGIAEETYFDVNVGGTQALCDAMSASDARDLCYFSSCAVYGATPEPRTEHSQPMPTGHYGKSKLEAERVIERWSRTGDGRTALVIRPPVVFGPGNFANMYALIDQIARRRFAQVGPGRNKKSMTFIDNLVAATMYLWRGGQTGVFNCVDKPDQPSADITAAVARALARPAPRFYVPLPVAFAAVAPIEFGMRVAGRDPRITIARIRKFAADRTVFESVRLPNTGFVPPVSLPDGIAAMVRWYVRDGAERRAEARLPSAETRRGLQIIEAEA